MDARETADSRRVELPIDWLMIACLLFLEKM